jgi:hypothetical protein
MHPKSLLQVFLLLIFYVKNVNAQQHFEKIYPNCLLELTTMLKNNALSFKDAVFAVENAYYDNILDTTQFSEGIESLHRLSLGYLRSNNLNYKSADSNKVKKWASIYKIMTDTITLIYVNKTIAHLPFYYDFDDIFGGKHWENMFVTKLLATRKGNCHSMPYLYKILCEELGVPCHLALAPNHIYVKHHSEKAGWYNTELTSASFPIDAWLMASGYITLQAIQSGIYMDALDDKQCIALCVLDLAKGFDRKYPDNDGTFIIKCCDLTLEHFPKCINALLFKAETRKKQIERFMKMLNISNPSVLRLQPEGQKLWEDMNRLYTQIHRLGYRTMPEQMYVEWLVSLQKEREKYVNKQVMEINKK